MMYGYHGTGNCFGLANGLMGGGPGMIMMLGFAVLFVAVIVILAKKKANHTTENIALDALKVRFAKGEISEEEYNRKKVVLR